GIDGREIKSLETRSRDVSAEIFRCEKEAISLERGFQPLSSSNFLTAVPVGSVKTCSANHKIAKLADFGLAREESLAEMMTAEIGTYWWMDPELYNTVIPRHDDKKHYNHKAAYDVAFKVHQISATFTGFEMYYMFHNL
ncbi:serine/threonine-protein kinase HT1-like protein, partial [Tanacetum coccineum]